MAVYKPQITQITLTPNPVNINTHFLISMKVAEVEIQLYRVSKISGCYKANEEITLNTRKEVV